MVTVAEPLPLETGDLPEPIEAPDLWRLPAAPRELEAAAQAWRRISQGASSGAFTVNSAAWSLHDHHSWGGDTAESYTLHRLRLTGDVDRAASVAGEAATALEEIAGTLWYARDRLLDDWKAVTRQVANTVRTGPDGRVTVIFHPDDDADTTVVTRAISDARDVHRYVDDVMALKMGALEKARTSLTDIARAWDAVATKGAVPFAVPPEVGGPTLIYDPVTHRAIINTGAGDDRIGIRSRFVALGVQRIVLTVEGQPDTSWTIPQETQITVRTGAGDDTVTGSLPGQDLTVVSGAGDDDVRWVDAHNMTVLAGAGNDRVTTFHHDDRLSGGAGDDTLTSAHGRDVFDGGGGNDTIVAGHEEPLFGNDGDDVIQGGDGDDTIRGGEGVDVIDGGPGQDDIQPDPGDPPVDRVRP